MHGSTAIVAAPRASSGSEATITTVHTRVDHASHAPNFGTP